MTASRRSGEARRDAVVVLGVLLVLGVLGGVLWSIVVTPAEYTKLADGGAMGEVDVARRFGADGWYAVIGALAGLVAGLGFLWWRSRDPLLTSVLLVVGSVEAAAVMALVGYLLGPGDPEAALRVAELGARVPERLDVDSFTAYLAWPTGALTGAFLVLMGHTPSDADAGVNRGSRTANSDSPASLAG